MEAVARKDAVPKTLQPNPANSPVQEARIDSVLPANTQMNSKTKIQTPMKSTAGAEWL